MAIIPLLKVGLIGATPSKAEVLAGLQELGVLHLIGEKDTESEIATTISEETHEAYLYLKQCGEKRRQVQDREGFDVHRITEETLRIKDRSRELEDRRDDLLLYIEALEPWGDFAFPDLADLAGHRFWFFIMPLYKLTELEELDLTWKCVYRDNRNAYVVVLSLDEPVDVPGERTHTGDRRLSLLKDDLTAIEEELDDLHWRRVGLTRWCTLFAQFLADADAEAALRRAAEQIFDDGELFLVQGWAPEEELGAIRSFAAGYNLIVRARPPEDDEHPPTLLENEPPLEDSEKFVEFYSTPSYHLWDPSIVVFLSFAVFFAMIISDAGYGLLLGLIWFLSRKRLKGSAKNLGNLFGFLVAGTVAYGVLAGSYFGLTPPEGSLLGMVKLFDVQDKNQMMFVSIIIGVVHLMLAHSINFIKAETLPARMAPAGWLIIMTGGLVTWAARAGVLAGPGREMAGPLVMGTGACLVLFFSSKRPWRGAKPRERLMRILEGLLALTGVTKAFGDILSYLRLFALGLASAQLAITFNRLAGDALENFPGTGMLLAVLILTVGHGLNFLLALMSGVVHGLRLNYIEFFNWGLAEEGYPFKPFRRRRISVWNQL